MWLPCDEIVWWKVLQNMTSRQCCMWGLEQALFLLKKCCNYYKGLFNSLFIFWSDISCAIDLYPCVRTCGFPFVCAFGFAFPSAAGPAVARTSDCLDRGCHRWWKWKVCNPTGSLSQSANSVVGIITPFIYSEVSGYLEWNLFRNTLLIFPVVCVWSCILKSLPVFWSWVCCGIFLSCGTKIVTGLCNLV